jgi:glycerol-3-phosphate acyltransferase PlsY
MPAQAILWTLIGFFSGSLMFSVWIGRAALGKDIRQVGDQNPGATNVLRSGGKGLFALAFALDVLKAAIPVGVAFWAVGIRDAWLIPVAIAPVAGHAFSPWLRFKGGKAMATSFGLWMALTIFIVPSVGGLVLGLGFALVTVSGWAVLFMCVIMTAFIGAAFGPLFMVIFLCNAVILLWKYRADLRQPPVLRDWLIRRIWPNSSSSSLPPPSASSPGSPSSTP